MQTLRIEEQARPDRPRREKALSCPCADCLVAHQQNPGCDGNADWFSRRQRTVGHMDQARGLLRAFAFDGVGDIKYLTLGEPSRPAFFIPYSQGLISSLQLVIRTAGDPAGIVEAVRKTIAGKDPQLALYEVRPLEQYVARSVAGERFETLAHFALAIQI